MDYTKIPLSIFLSSGNETIRRNATSILKILQMAQTKGIKRYCTKCGYVEAQLGLICEECGREMTGLI